MNTATPDKVAFEERLSCARATNIVLAALCEGIEKNIFPLWARLRDGDEAGIYVADFEIYPPEKEGAGGSAD